MVDRPALKSPLSSAAGLRSTIDSGEIHFAIRTRHGMIYVPIQIMGLCRGFPSFNFFLT